MIQNAIIGTIMVVGGVYLIRVGLKIKAKIKEARLWPHARGRLTKLETIGQGPKVIGTDDYRQYMLRISYDYEVKGQQYTNDRAVFGSEIEVKAEIDEFCGQFQENSEIKVFYSPEDPQDSVLMIDRPGAKQAREYYFGIILVMFGVLIGVVGGGYLG
jgi:hypothetical protein